MIYAAIGGYMDIVRLMLDRGANNYNEAVTVATEGEHIEIVRLIQEYQNE